jgi:hypothetical protein
LLALPKQPRGSSRLNNLLAIVAGPRALGRRGPTPSAANYLSYLCMALRHPSTNQKSVGPLGSVVHMHFSTVLNIRHEHGSTVYPYSIELAYIYSVPPHSAPSAHAFVLTDTYRDFIRDDRRLRGAGSGFAHLRGKTRVFFAQSKISAR